MHCLVDPKYMHNKIHAYLFKYEGAKVKNEIKFYSLCLYVLAIF